MLLLTLSQIVGYVVSVIIFLVIVQFVMSLLLAFNVVNRQNEFVFQIYRAVTVLLDPLLNPIRRIMPNTGTIDFSPLVLIVGLNILRILLENLAVSQMT